MNWRDKTLKKLTPKEIAEISALPDPYSEAALAYYGPDSPFPLVDAHGEPLSPAEMIERAKAYAAKLQAEAASKANDTDESGQTTRERLNELIHSAPDEPPAKEDEIPKELKDELLAWQQASVDAYWKMEDKLSREQGEPQVEQEKKEDLLFDDLNKERINLLSKKFRHGLLQEERDRLEFLTKVVREML